MEIEVECGRADESAASALKRVLGRVEGHVQLKLECIVDGISNKTSFNKLVT